MYVYSADNHDIISVRVYDVDDNQAEVNPEVNFSKSLFDYKYIYENIFQTPDWSTVTPNAKNVESPRGVF